MSDGRDDEALREVLRLFPRDPHGPVADAIARVVFGGSEVRWLLPEQARQARAAAAAAILALDLPALIAEAEKRGREQALREAANFLEADADAAQGHANPRDYEIVTWLKGLAASIGEGDHVVSETRTAREPLLVSAMRRNPTGEVRIIPEGGGVTGTTTRGFLAELDEWVAALIAEARGEALREVRTSHLWRGTDVPDRHTDDTEDPR